jgi:integrase
MAKKLSKPLQYKNARPDPKKRLELPDADVRGLYLIIQPQPSGVKSWCYRYRVGKPSKPCKLTLGTYVYVRTDNKGPELGGALSLDDARELARDAATDLAKGVDPAARKRALKIAPPAPKEDGDRLVDIVAKFDARYLKVKKVAGLRDRAEYLRILNQQVLPLWGERPIAEIKKRDVNDLLDTLRDRGLTGGVNKTFAVVRKLFNWAVSRDMIEVSPCGGIEAPAPIVRRDRVLTSDELRWFWQACEKIGWPFGPLFKVLLLTGQRREEVGSMTAAEVSDGLWTLPGARTKNGKPHDVPLSAVVLAILGSLPPINTRAGFRFCTGGRKGPKTGEIVEKPVSGFSRAKCILDRKMLEIAREETGNPALKIPEWRLHDLRRTCATGLQRLGVRFEVTEAVLNHQSGSKSGVAGIYQRHDWKEEKRAALETWSRFIISVVNDRPTDNVINLCRA